MIEALEQGEVQFDVLTDEEIAYTVRQDEPPQTYIHEDVVRAQIEAAVKRALEGAASVEIVGDPLRSIDPMVKHAIRALDPAQFIDGDKT